MERERTLYGDWMGCWYWLGGERAEWTLSLLPDGTYRLTEAIRDQDPTHEVGRFVYDESQETIEFAPDGGNEVTRYRIRDIAGTERVNTLLILRRAVLASRNLPIMLYRVHHDPHGWRNHNQITDDRH